MLSTYNRVLLRLLAESRVSDSKVRYPQVSNKIDELVSAIPAELHKYVPWAAKQMSKDESLDPKTLADTLVDFDKNIQRIKDKNVDSYKTFDELKIVVDSITSTQSKTQKKNVISSDVDKIYKSNKFLVIVPKSKEASCKYGAGTKWCISGKENNKFDEYNRMVIINMIFDIKNNKKYAYVIGLNPDNELKGVEIFDEKDDKMTEIDFKNIIGDEFDVIKQNMLSYAKASGKGKLTPKKAKELALSSTLEDRLLVAANKNTPVDVLRLLSKDKNAKVLVKIINNENTPEDIVQNLNSTELYLSIINTTIKNDAIFAEIALSSKTPAPILDMLASVNPTLKSMIATNSNTSVETLRKLATDKNRYVKSNVAFNAKTPADVLDMLATIDDIEIRCFVADNKNTSLKTLEKLTKDKSSYVSDKAKNAIERLIELS